MSTPCRVLFQVAMRHTYFADGYLRELTAQPTPATAERLRRLGWLFKPLPDGFAVLGAVPAQPDEATLARLGSWLPLLFSLSPRDPLFFNYSDVDPVPGCTRLYRLSAAPAKSGGGQVVAGPVLALRPLVFTQPVAAPAPGGRTARLQSLSHGGQWLPGQPVPAPATSVVLDLNPWGSGAYRWEVGTDVCSFYADDYLAATQPWAVLEVGAPMLRALPGTRYILNFTARATYWEYQLVARNAAPPTGLEIKTGTSTAFALVPGRVGEPPVWRASQAVPLSQHYPMPPYQLLGFPHGQSQQRTPQIMLAALPQATPATLRKVLTAEGSLPISDILVSV